MNINYIKKLAEPAEKSSVQNKPNIHSRLTFRRAFAMTSLVVLPVALVGCNPKKKDKLAYTELPANSVSLTSFQTLDDPNWLTDDSGNLLTNAATVSIGGVCSQGANTVVIQIDGTDVGSNPDCNTSGRNWTYSGAFAGADGAHTLVVYGKGKDGTLYTDLQISKTITKDTVAPSITGFSAPAASPYTTYAPTLTISGAVSGDYYVVTATDVNGNFTFNTAGGTFDFVTSAITAGETRTITFTAYDRAGNASATANRVVHYPGPFTSLAGPLSMYRESAMGQAAPITSGTTVLNNSAVSTVGTTNSVTSVDGNFVLETGLATSMTQ